MEFAKAIQNLVMGGLYSITYNKQLVGIKSYTGVQLLKNKNDFRGIGKYIFESPFILLEIDNSQIDSMGVFCLKILHKGTVGWIQVFGYDIITKLS